MNMLFFSLSEYQRHQTIIADCGLCICEHARVSDLGVCQSGSQCYIKQHCYSKHRFNYQNMASH